MAVLSSPSSRSVCWSHSSSPSSSSPPSISSSIGVSDGSRGSKLRIVSGGLTLKGRNRISREALVSGKTQEAWSGRDGQGKGKKKGGSGGGAAGAMMCSAEGIGRRLERGQVGRAAVAIPERTKVLLMLAVVMCLCNADRVVMSVAVVPLASRYGWSSSFLGIVQQQQVFTFTT